MHHIHVGKLWSPIHGCWKGGAQWRTGGALSRPLCLWAWFWEGVITSLSYFQENARIIKYSYTPSTFSFICQGKKAGLKNYRLVSWSSSPSAFRFEGLLGGHHMHDPLHKIMASQNVEIEVHVHRKWFCSVVKYWVPKVSQGACLLHFSYLVICRSMPYYM